MADIDAHALAQNMLNASLRAVVPDMKTGFQTRMVMIGAMASC